MSTQPVTLTVDGIERRGQFEDRTLLTDALRVMGVNTVNTGCEQGVCGACTILIDGVPARACLCFARQVEGQPIETVGTLGSSDDLDALQRAFARHHALQCGFCTPGILMTMTAAMRDAPALGEDAVRDLLAGHICRCTGYASIVAAVLDADAERRAR